MADDASLHVVFTMNCEPAATRWALNSPKGWNISGRSMYSFCKRLLSAGFPATLFVAPLAAEVHAPLLQELADAGIEMGILLQPQTLERGYRRFFGELNAERQRDVVARSTALFYRSLGFRPRSVRSAMFSASDATFPVLAEEGMVHSSMSIPGRRVRKHASVWTGAPSDAHLADSESRLRAGTLPIFELPVTADAKRVVGGISSDMCLEYSKFVEWHSPLLDSHLERLEAEAVPFKTLCIYTSNACDYSVESDTPTANLLALLNRIEQLNSRYHVQPATLAKAHLAYLQQQS